VRVHVDDIFRAIGKFAVKFRWVVLIVWIAAAAVIPRALPSLASVTQGNNSAFLPANAPSQQAANLAAPLGFSTSTVPIPVVAAVSTGSFTAADQAWLGTLATDLGKVPTVVKVRELGLSQVPGPNGAAGQAAQLQVQSNVGTGDENAVSGLVDNLRAAIASSSPPAGMQAHLAGQFAINVDQQKQSGKTGNQVQDAAFVFILILLLLIFRALLAPLITVIPALLSVAISGPIIAEFANHGLKVSQLSQLLLIVLVLGAGTDYGLFLVFRVRERLREGDNSKDAVVNALTKVGESITFSAFTVIAALLSLLFATFQIYSNLGIPLAIGIGVMLLAGLTLLPALLAIFGKAAFWPSKHRPGAEVTGMWGRIAARVLKRPAVALTIGVLVFGALSAAVVNYHSAGFGGTISAPAGTDSAAGTNLLNKYFPSTAANPTNLVYKLSVPAWQDAAAIETATAHLTAAKDVFSGVTGPLNPVGGAGFTPTQYTQLHGLLGSGPFPATAPAEPAAATATGITATQWAEAYQLYRATAQFVSPDGKTIQFEASLTAGDPSTTAALSAVPAVRAEAATVAATLHATDYGVTGEAPAIYDISSISNSDLAHVIPIAIIVIGVLLALVMRSLVAPLYLIASVALSYFAALGLAVLLFIELGHSDGITFILPFLLFIFLLALGEDYNILVMTRIREEAHHLPLREAVTRAVSVTGTTVTSAGLVLAGTFAVFAIVGGGGSGGEQVRDIGYGLAVGVIMDTFVVRTVLVPCTVALLGRWNWWPSKLHVDAPVTGTDAVGASADALGLSGAQDGQDGQPDESTDRETRRKS
jgi:putative drug exporter of the RND superfamily